MSGEQRGRPPASPQLEGFRAKGVEVLLLTDPIDEFWLPRSAAQGQAVQVGDAGADADLVKIEGQAGETSRSRRRQRADADLDA